MIKGIFTAARSLEYKAKNINIIANNLANLSTTGYKREIPFSEMINQAGDVQIKKFTNQQQGDFIQTANPLDLAISGKGFFAVKNDSGEIELTRNGRFQISDEGLLIDRSGKKVLGKNGPVIMDETLLNKNPTILITKAGEIKIGDRLVDTLLVLNVNNPNELYRSDGSNFLTDGQEYFPASVNEYGVSQGYLEAANTNVIEEMEAMIQLNKDSESAQKIITALDQSLGQANEIGKV